MNAQKVVCTANLNSRTVARRAYTYIYYKKCTHYIPPNILFYSGKHLFQTTHRDHINSFIMSNERSAHLSYFHEKDETQVVHFSSNRAVGRTQNPGEGGE